MNFEVIFLAILQGITEFLPVSSSGHLIIFENILNVNNDDMIVLDLVLHLGTLFSFFYLFKNELILKFKKERENDKNDLIYYFLASVPLGFVGLVLSLLDLIDKMRNPIFVSGMFLFSGFLFVILKFLKSEKSEKSEISKSMIFKVGIIEILGLVPGISRSGITTFGGISLGLSRKSALKTSFYLFVPAVFFSMGKIFLDIFSGETLNFEILDLILGFSLSFLTGVFSGKLLLKYFENIGLFPFGIYLIFIGFLGIFIELF